MTRCAGVSFLDADSLTGWTPTFFSRGSLPVHFTLLESFRCDVIRRSMANRFVVVGMIRVQANHEPSWLVAESRLSYPRHTSVILFILRTWRAGNEWKECK